MILRNEFNKYNNSFGCNTVDSVKEHLHSKHNNLVDLSIHPLNTCKHFVDDELFNFLIQKTKWLDIEALNDIKYLLANPINSELYIKGLIHRLDQVEEKIEISVIRYDYRRLKALASIISGFISELIGRKNGVDICPAALLKDLNLLDNKEKCFSCRLPIINLPSGKKSVQLNKLQCARWWFRKLNKKINQQRELLKIAIGVVCHDNQPYASNETVTAYKRKVDAEKDFLSGMYFKCNKSGNSICLADLKSSDQRRFSEFLVESKGIEKIAKSKGLISSLVTFTLPPKYHANPMYGDSSAWKGYTPKDGYVELTSITDRFNKMIHRACLYKDNSYYSIRAVESHHDATPHFHILVFYKSEFKDIIKNAIAYQFGDDCFNLTSKAYNWIDIDENRSSPVHYLCKHFTYTDDLKKENIRISANKYIWDIKSFEFTGLLPGAKTLWKELRKNKADIDLTAIEKKLQKLAINNDFYGFIGALEKPDILLTICYKTTVSRYGEEVKTVSGVSVTENKTHIVQNKYFLDKKNEILSCFWSIKTKLVKVVTNISNIVKILANNVKIFKSNQISSKMKDFFTSKVNKQYKSI